EYILFHIPVSPLKGPLSFTPTKEELIKTI
ncbi:hypothetical protein VN97_g12429, partial [Penicillium thymicola]